MKQQMLDALKLQYNANYKQAKLTLDVYLKNAVGIGEHPQFIHEIDKQLELIASAEETLKTLKNHYPTDDDIPF